MHSLIKYRYSLPRGRQRKHRRNKVRQDKEDKGNRTRQRFGGPGEAGRGRAMPGEAGRGRQGSTRRGEARQEEEGRDKNKEQDVA